MTVSDFGAALSGMSIGDYKATVHLPIIAPDSNLNSELISIQVITTDGPIGVYNVTFVNSSEALQAGKRYRTAAIRGYPILVSSSAHVQFDEISDAGAIVLAAGLQCELQVDLEPLSLVVNNAAISATLLDLETLSTSLFCVRYDTAPAAVAQRWIDSDCAVVNVTVASDGDGKTAKVICGCAASTTTEGNRDRLYAVAAMSSTPFTPPIPPGTAEPPLTPSPSSPYSLGLVIGAAVGGGTLLLVFVAGCAAWFRRRNQRRGALYGKARGLNGNGSSVSDLQLAHTAMSSKTFLEPNAPPEATSALSATGTVQSSTAVDESADNPMPGAGTSISDHGEADLTLKDGPAIGRSNQLESR